MPINRAVHSASIYNFWGLTIILGVKLLFDERPKENRGELFDRAKEIEEIKKIT